MSDHRIDKFSDDLIELTTSNHLSIEEKKQMSTSLYKRYIQLEGECSTLRTELVFASVMLFISSIILIAGII